MFPFKVKPPAFQREISTSFVIHLKSMLSEKNNFYLNAQHFIKKKFNLPISSDRLLSEHYFLYLKYLEQGLAFNKIKMKLNQMTE